MPESYRSAQGLLVGGIFVSILVFSVPSPVQCQEGDAETVARMAFAFMAALSGRDTERLDGMLAQGAVLYSVRESENGTLYGVRTRDEFLEGLAGGSSPFVERIWDPVVELSGRVAMVWAPYDFHSGGDFSHCGVDLLTFLKLREGWKVTSITYDVVREGCPASPLGPPGGGS